MTASLEFLDLAITVALALLSISLLLATYVVVRGPGLPERVVGLDMLVATAIGYIAIMGIKTGFSLYVDIAIALGLVGFLATVALARFIMSRSARDTEQGSTPAAEDAR